MYGYAGKLLDVNLTAEKIKAVPLTEDITKKWFGGRGLGVYLLWKEFGEHWEHVNPLGEENLLLVLNGPLTGYYPGMKTAVVSKSPESNGVIGSVLSSEVGLELKAAGYDGLIIRGKAERPRYLLIHNNHVEIRDASKYWGLRGIDTTKRLMKEAYDEILKLEKVNGKPKEPAIMYIGPAGEHQIRFASIMAKWAHAAGYGGYGAVMGSKNLKAIVVKGTGSLPPVADVESLKNLIKQVYKTAYNSTTFRLWGTVAGAYNTAALTSSEPVRNWQEEWHNNEEISVSKFESKVWVKRFWGDYGCPITCMKVSYIRYGPYKGAVTDGPDYELIAYLGPNLGIFKPEDSVYLSWLADEYGFDGINLGNILGYTAELYQRGYLTKEELSGLDPKWGNTDAFAKLTELIANKEGIGKLLAEGTYRAAVKLSEQKKTDLLKYAVQSKGIGIGAHGVRSKRDYTGPLSYVTSVQGGDHTSIARPVATSEGGETRFIFYDSAVVCFFVAWVGFDTLIDFTNAVTGWDLTKDKWINDIGMRILHTQRLELLLGGPDVFWDPRISDDNPPRFYEPLPSGPFKDARLTKDEINELRKAYYQEVGYDENGIPLPQKVKELGIPNGREAITRIKQRLNAD